MTERRKFIDGLRANQEAGWSGDALDSDEVAEVLAMADEIERLRAALFAVERYCGSAETYDPKIEAICRDALTTKDIEG